jgi:tRNA pseudouridine55 synthase
MARKRKGRPINGVLLVDKPSGVSSNYVVQGIKRMFKAAKAGHTGALDPLATGLLPVCLGEATKFSQFLLDADKAYEVVAKLGQRTDTSDADGQIVETHAVDVCEADIKNALTQFLGNIKQVPSMFSALKHEGKPLYFYARQGIHIDRPARDICIHSIDWLGLNGDELTLAVKCSKGTYIRTLVDDLGQVLGCTAHVKELRRTQVAHYDASQMHTFEALGELAAEVQDENFSSIDKLLLSMDTPIKDLPLVNVDELIAAYFMQGRAISVDDTQQEGVEAGDVWRVYAKQDNRFLGVAFVDSENNLQPKRLVVYS